VEARGAGGGAAKSLMRAAVLVAALTLAGRALGFLRDVLIARYFGASADTDAFLVAWTVPETASPLLVETAVIYALVPVFVRAWESEGSATAAIDRIAAPTLVALGLLTALLALGAPILVSALVPGIAEYDLAVRSFRVASLTVLGFGLAGFLIAALRSREIFGVPATVYLAYNAAIIAMLLLLHEDLGVFSAAVGLAVGAAATVLVQLPSYLRNIGWPRWSRGSIPYARMVFLPLIPIAAFVFLRHAQIYIERFAGSLIEPGAISFLSFAERVGQVPLALTIAIAVVSFPAIARSAAAGRVAELRRSFERDLKLVTLLMVPAIVILIVLAEPLIEVLLERGSFSERDTEVTSGVMQAYSWGLLAHGVMAVAVLPVYSLGVRVAMPIRSALIGLGVTAAAAAAAAPLLGPEGLALASALGATVMALDLLARVHGSVLTFDVRDLRQHLLKLALAGLAAAAAALPFALAFEDAPLIQVLTGGAAASAAYVIVARALRTDHLQDLLRPLARAFARSTSEREDRLG
jgi:putative peptidoglycan lipid II flippase